MSNPIVAVFVFSNGCSSCMDFKDVIYEGHRSAFDIVKNEFNRTGVKVKTFYKNDSDLPHHLRITKFYPVMMLMTEEEYYNGMKMAPSELYSKIKIFSADIEKNSMGKYTSGNYKGGDAYLNPREYISFCEKYSEFRSRQVESVNRLLPDGDRTRPVARYLTSPKGKAIRLKTM